MSRICIKLTEKELEVLQNRGEIRVPVHVMHDYNYSNLREIDIRVDEVNSIGYEKP